MLHRLHTILGAIALVAQRLLNRSLKTPGRVNFERWRKIEVGPTWRAMALSEPRTSSVVSDITKRRSRFVEVRKRWMLAFRPVGEMVDRCQILDWDVWRDLTVGQHG